MPSPFPGMDPYLENPATWPDVHHGLISELQVELNRQVRPKYFVSVEERVYISDETDPARAVIVPDLQVARTAGERRREAAASQPVGTPEPLVVTTLIEEEVREAHLEIVDAQLRQVVAVIEVVSPANKVAGSRGRTSYFEKRREVMKSSAHWLEIDLLREGEPVTAAEVLPEGDYFVHLSRVDARPKGFVWPILLRQRLPRIPVPLRSADPEAAADLQALLESVYERSAYDLKIDYRREPKPPLRGEDAAWADELLRKQGRR